VICSSAHANSTCAGIEWDGFGLVKPFRLICLRHVAPSFRVPRRLAYYASAVERMLTTDRDVPTEALTGSASGCVRMLRVNPPLPPMRPIKGRIWKDRWRAVAMATSARSVPWDLDTSPEPEDRAGKPSWNFPLLRALRPDLDMALPLTLPTALLSFPCALYVRREQRRHIHPCITPLSSGQHDTYGSALAAQPGRSQGGQLLTRALSSWNRSACPLSVPPVPLVPDGRTIRRKAPSQPDEQAPRSSYQLRILWNA
jgi:hypothetical protein